MWSVKRKIEREVCMCVCKRRVGGDGRKESKVSLSGGFNSIIIMRRHPLWDLEHTHFSSEDVHRSDAAEGDADKDQSFWENTLCK